MSADEIQVEVALAYLFEDIATELQLIAGDLQHRPFVCVEERFSIVCEAMNRARLATRSIGMGNPGYTLSLIDRIRQDTGLMDSAADAANEWRQAQARARNDVTPLP